MHRPEFTPGASSGQDLRAGDPRATAGDGSRPGPACWCASQVYDCNATLGAPLLAHPERVKCNETASDPGVATSASCATPLSARPFFPESGSSAPPSLSASRARSCIGDSKNTASRSRRTRSRSNGRPSPSRPKTHAPSVATQRRWCREDAGWPGPRRQVVPIRPQLAGVPHGHPSPPLLKCVRTTHGHPLCSLGCGKRTAAYLAGTF